MTDYQRIEKAINYIRSNFKSQPDLDEVAAHVALSPFHFQRLFTEWAGVSPKKFLQYLSLDHAKSLLKNNRQATLFDVTQQTGLSGTGRLHDLFITIEGMTPGEFKNEGEQLHISYEFYETPFGRTIAASTPKGICHLAFVNEDKKGLEELRSNFPKAKFERRKAPDHECVVSFFNQRQQASKLNLHLKGTPFQLKVWEALLKIPTGMLVSYGQLAKDIKAPKASRAVGSAIGSNPVAFLIPCHRVIQSGGNFGNYMWGTDRKASIIVWEAALVERNR